jgi:hypothetical protein
MESEDYHLQIVLRSLQQFVGKDLKSGNPRYRAPSNPGFTRREILALANHLALLGVLEGSDDRRDT